MKKLPFTKEDYFKMLEAKLGTTTVSNSPIEKLKQAVLRLRGGNGSQES